jgi:hypothetical protein
MYQYQQVARQKPRVRPIEVSPLHPHAEDQAITICDSCLGPALLDQAPLKLVRRGVETRTRYCERHGSILERQEKAGARLEADGGGSLSLPPRPSLPSSSSLAPFRPAACNTGVRPTVYIVSFSTDLTPHTRALARLLALHLPVRDAPIPHVCTVDATTMAVPPADVCAAYSGVSRLVQECVMLDPRAREHTRRAVQDVMECVEQRRRKGAVGAIEVAVSVGCTAGTHRSVAMAEGVAAGILGQVRNAEWDEGIKVVVRHVHRIRGPRDAF